MELFRGLIWTLFQVCWTLDGPETVTAPLGGSLSVQCKYGKEDKKSVKYWCKEEGLTLCSSSHTVRTTRMEAEGMNDRMSIKDNHTFHKFTVTMENLTNEDAGTYICGVERAYNIWHPVEVIITDSVPSTHFGSMEQATEEPAVSPVDPERTQPSNTDFLLLVMWKIPVFLAMLAAVVWVHVWYRKTRGSSNPKAPETEEEL
ncbi:CMRF35-like molecule 7 [Podarcis lilfordi]|uniref:CMRF35-like molecule 7 n=1 Tax=Podarcis lilfordi TaxID=74358 RepID=A0AA35NZC8_9SAUR|nr:CMRF35-like molecule 7 [Podarcis lilfordi]